MGKSKTSNETLKAHSSKLTNLGWLGSDVHIVGLPQTPLRGRSQAILGKAMEFEMRVSVWLRPGATCRTSPPHCQISCVIAWPFPNYSNVSNNISGHFQNPPFHFILLMRKGNETRSTFGRSNSVSCSCCLVSGQNDRSREFSTIIVGQLQLVLGAIALFAVSNSFLV